MRTIRTPATREVFLRVLSECGNISAAAEAAGIGRNALYEWRRNDPQFTADWEAALALGAEGLEDEARERAMNGSDVLLMFLLRGIKPEKYRDRSSIDVNRTHTINYRDFPITELHTRLNQLRAEQEATPHFTVLTSSENEP